MAQATTWDVYQAADAPVTPTNWASRMKDMLEDASLSSHSGATRPSYAVDGMIWLDTDIGVLFQYDGAADLTISVGGLRSQVHASLTIATDSVTPTGPGTFAIITEGAPAVDDLSTIVATNVQDGDILILKAADGADTVTVKHDVGNISCGADFALDNIRDRITLQYDLGDTRWVCISSNSNGT